MGLTKEDEYNAEDNVDYDILESKDQFTRKPVPSDRFRKSGYKSIRHSQLANKRFHQQIMDFRKKVESNLKLRPEFTARKDSSVVHGNQNYADNFGILGLQYASVDDLVRQTTKRIRESDSDENKYSIIQSTIMGVERYTDVDYDVMLMFHETVINPLTILFTVYKMINHWNRFANSLDVGDGDFTTDTMLAKCAKNLKGLPGNEKYRKNMFDQTLNGNTGGISPNFLHKYLYFDGPDYIRYRYNFRYPNTKNLMEDTINHLFYLTCDKNPMVEMYFSGDGANRYPMLSFKRLEQCVTPLIACVESALVKFRKVLPYEIVKKYESAHQKDFQLTGTEPTTPNVVSLFYIKEHLVDRLINNKYGAGLSDSNNALKNIWLYLTKDPTKLRHQYKDIFSRLLIGTVL